MAPVLSFVLAVATLSQMSYGQTDNLGLSGGYTTFSTSNFQGSLVKNSQTLASLKPASNTAFDFLAYDFLSQRAYNTAHHIGDVTFRYRASGGSSWTSADSASSRKPVTALSSLSSGVFAASNLSPTLPSGLPFTVTREWLKVGQDIGLRFNFTNTGSSSVDIGALGMPIYINNIFSNREASAVRTGCSLADPYIGVDAGYVRVSPVGGVGAGLAIVPLGKSPFEAWTFLNESQGTIGYQEQTFEGSYAWQVHSLAYAQNEWASVTPWNKATSKTLAAGETYSVGLRLAVSSSIQTIEDAVVGTGTPLAVGVPGFIVPSDAPATLILNYTSSVSSIDTAGAFSSSVISGSTYKLTPSGSVWGRARVTITYADGKVQTVHYYITKSSPEAVANLGSFLTTTSYFTDTSDPFGRAPSVISYDREANKQVTQDGRVWIAGLSDEAGAGSYLAATMKQSFQPNANEITKLDNFVHQTLQGDIQATGSYGVKASIFYYQPGAVSYNYDTSINWNTWAAWNKARAYTTTRAYNYVHATAAYWAMYRASRDHPSITTQSNWTWYLNNAYQTIQYCLGGANQCDYSDFGLMGETVTGEILKDLNREGLTTQFNTLQATMKTRATTWNGQSDPYGSEMGWDSTGQEGVYYWSDYFGFTSTALKTLNSITGYMPTVAHWGYNGNARRYWDFLYGGKLQRIERQLHHYGSGLNALPMLSYFEKNPTDIYRLRVGYAGSSAAISNIDQSGFASAAFHSYADTLKWDAYSGDYGPNFLGMSLGQTAYVINAARYGGWLGFGATVSVSGSTVNVTPTDAVRRRLFIASTGLKIEVSAGAISAASFSTSGGAVTFTLQQAVSSSALKATEAIVWLTQPSKSSVGYTISGATAARGGFQVTIASGGTTVTVSPK